MKKLLSAIAISVSAIMAASSAFAAPEHAQGHQPAPQQHSAAPQAHQQAPGQAKKAQPQQNWKAGNKYPTQYRGAGYKVDYKHDKKLSKPGKNQQWYKADGQYILVNTATYAIIKVLGL